MKTFKRLGFELSYLALLTKDNVKPLSRWEDGISYRKIKALQKLGLKTRVIKRKLLNHSSTHELIFSKSSRYLDFYANRFDKTFIKKDYKTVISEGFLFGYPGCCVKNFAENGYTKNDYTGNSQEILFHWVCPNCRITPSILPYYEKVHKNCKEIFSNQGMNGPRLLKTLLPAAALSMIISVLPTNVRGDNPHWLPIGENDPDNDYLTYQEEVILGTHLNYFPDDSLAGQAKALEFKAIIDSLPIDSSDTTCYVIEHLYRGIETCQICGEVMNMGFIEVVNPMRDLSIDIPFMALHFLENGSFSYDGTTNSGRIDIELLKEVIAHYDSTHFSIVTSNDEDNDGLNDDYEDDFSTQINNPDSDENQLVDGAEVAEELIETIAGLPVIEYNEEPPSDSIYIKFMLADGIETCDICGIAINMGDVRIVNPTIKEEINFSIIGLHYLAHGRFAYGGSENSGEIDALQLAQVLRNQAVVSILEKLPDRKDFRMKNYPNPFNPSTTISYHLPRSNFVTLRIYNITGQLIETLVNGHNNAGYHTVLWNASEVGSGLYFYKIEAGEYTETKKCLILK